MDPPGIRRTESHFRGARGHALFQRAWLPSRPQRALVLLHGLGEHSGRYEPMAAWFAARGCSVHAYDQQGHGRSGGARGHARHFSDLVDDLEAFLGEVRSRHRGIPVFPIGHSMGGLVLVSLLQQRPAAVAGAVTSAVALALPVGASRGRLLGVRLLRLLAPRLRISTGINPSALSRDPDVARGYAEDPLVQRRISASLTAELLDALQRAGQSAVLRVPMLLLHGEADALCPPDGSRRLQAQLAVEGSRLVTYPRLRHEIFNEPERHGVFQDVLDWLRKVEQTSSGGAHAQAFPSG